MAICQALEIELAELEDWNCCGAMPYSSAESLEATCIPARNLVLAEKKGLDLVTPCSACYIVLNKANSHLKDYPALKSQVDEALAAAELEYRGNVRVRHLAEVLHDDITPESIESNVQKKLSGLKVAPYYGCQLVRPKYGFDDPELPHSLDRLVESLGAEAVPFPMKARCCGGSLITSEENSALELIHKILESAQSNGAQCIVTPCPLCQINLDAYQGKTARKFKTKYNLPVLFITQLIGIALDLPLKALALEKSIVSPMKQLAPYL